MNIYVWGTGCGAGDLIDTALDASRVTAFVDENPGSGSFLGRPVISPREIAPGETDLVIAGRMDAFRPGDPPAVEEIKLWQGRIPPEAPLRRGALWSCGMGPLSLSRE